LKGGDGEEDIFDETEDAVILDDLGGSDLGDMSTHIRNGRSRVDQETEQSRRQPSQGCNAEN
jgi:hypothetical protein